MPRVWSWIQHVVPNVVPYVALLQAIVALAKRDLVSKKPELHEDAREFFAPGGGLDQWREKLR